MTTYLPHCAALASGISAGILAHGAGSLWPLAVALVPVSAMLGHGFGWRYATHLAIGLVGLALALHGQPRQSQGDSRTHAVYVVETAKRSGDRAYFVAEEGIRVMLPEGTGLPLPGERWECSGFLKDRWLWVNGSRAFARRISAPSRIFTLRQRLRKTLSRRIGIGLDHDPDAAALNRAILLGERSKMPRELRDAFVGAGTLHVFAISGLHVMTVAHLLMLALLPLGWRRASFAVVPILWAYVWLIGAPPSATRAAGMATVWFVAAAFARKPDALVAWSLTFIVTHLADPARLFDVGNALSFAVMLAVVMAARWANGRGAFLAITLAAWAAGTPIAAHVFARVTPGGILANLALLPAAGCTVVAGMLGIASSFVSNTIAAHVNNAAALFTNLMTLISKAVASLPGANLEPGPWPISRCVAWYLALAAAFLLMRRRAELRRPVKF